MSDDTIEFRCRFWLRPMRAVLVVAPAIVDHDPGDEDEPSRHLVEIPLAWLEAFA